MDGNTPWPRVVTTESSHGAMVRMDSWVMVTLSTISSPLKSISSGASMCDRSTVDTHTQVPSVKERCSCGASIQMVDS